jgi:acetolactate synthase-1/2/3 large subunit
MSGSIGSHNPAHDRVARRVRVSVARFVVRCLKAENVQTVFVLPGGPIMPLVAALFATRGLRVVLAKHEAGAAFMADGYQRLAGGVAVCVVTAGPGAINALTAVSCAYRDGIPLLVISGQPGLSAFGRDPTQDSSSLGVDTVEIYRRVTKQSVLLTDPERIADVVRLLARTALSGRPGPVHLAIPADLLNVVVPGEVRPPVRYRAAARPVDLAAVERMAQLLLSSRQPVVVAGSGIRSSSAQAELRQVVERLGLMTCTTPRAKGVLPEDHPLSLGVFGFAGSARAERAVFSPRTDCLLVIGSRLGELSSHAWDRRLARKRIIQVDIDGAEISKHFPVEVPVVADARAALLQLLRSVGRKRRARPVVPVRAPRLLYSTAKDGRGAINPRFALAEMARVLPPQSVLYVDVGNCMAFALHDLVVRNTNGFHLNLSAASMGHGVAAVVGGKLARPGQPAVALCGDGAFAMTGAEVHTAVEQRVACVWVVLNNGGFGSIRMGVRRQFQDAGGARARLMRMTRYRRPLDIARIAEGMGALSFRVETSDQLGPALQRALQARRPAVLDVRVDIEEEPPMGVRLRLLDRFFTRRGRT